jgi:hypothetical protein
MRKQAFEVAFKMDTFLRVNQIPPKEVSNDIQRYFAKARRMPETMRD